CLLVTPGEGPSIQVQKVLSMVDKNFEIGKRVLEVNKDNPLIRSLVELNKEDAGSLLVTQCCEQLFENAMLVEGLVPDPSQMVARIQKIMEKAAGVG
ncbi:MAG: molecular chaperone HtpG, partial [Thermodesulfobacteriota bacterium]